jgi:general stress protein 26
MAKNDLKQTVRDLLQRHRYSKLITIGVDGTPRGRIMTHLPPEKDMIIWYATGLHTNKIKEIKRNPEVSVFVDHPTDNSGVSIVGKAEILTDERLRKKYWQDAWGFFWPDGPSNPDYCLLKITPMRMEYFNPGPAYHPDLKRTIVKL